MINKSKKTDMNDFEQSIVLSVTCIPMTQVFMLLAGSMPTGLALFLLWCPVIWQISAVLFCNKVLQKQSAQKIESLEWLDFVCSISNFCWIFCTCHYGLGKTFWLN